MELCQGWASRKKYNNKIHYVKLTCGPILHKTYIPTTCTKRNYDPRVTRYMTGTHSLWRYRASWLYLIICTCSEVALSSMWMTSNLSRASRLDAANRFITTTLRQAKTSDVNWCSSRRSAEEQVRTSRTWNPKVLLWCLRRQAAAITPSKR